MQHARLGSELKMLSVRNSALLKSKNLKGCFTKFPHLPREVRVSEWSGATKIWRASPLLIVPRCSIASAPDDPFPVHVHYPIPARLHRLYSPCQKVLHAARFLPARYCINLSRSEPSLARRFLSSLTSSFKKPIRQ